MTDLSKQGTLARWQQLQLGRANTPHNAIDKE